MDFTYNLPVNLMFGRGKFELLGETVAKYGKKAIIVADPVSTKVTGLLDRAIANLKASGIESVVFDNVMPNPLTTTAIEGAELAKANGCDVVVGIGGGSIMDCAKAVSFLCVNDGDINDYIFNIKVSDKALPSILVPTTCGTGSEGNGFAVLTNPDSGDKKSLRCNAIVAKASIIDSKLMETMPKSVLASCGFDAFTHSVEAYLSVNGQPFTDMLAMYGMKLVGESLLELYKGNETPELWDKITLASTIGGMVINTAGVTVAHGMEHPASGLKNLVHGRGLASLTPIVMKKTVDAAPEKCAIISQALGGKDHTDCVAKIEELLEALNLNITLGQQGVVEEDIAWMTENFFKISAAGLANHPVKFTKEEIAEIFRLAI